MIVVQVKAVMFTKPVILGWQAIPIKSSNQYLQLFYPTLA